MNSVVVFDWVEKRKIKNVVVGYGYDKIWVGLDEGVMGVV